MAAYVRKTVDVWHVLVDYGQGWEHECSEASRKEAREQVKTYRANQNYPVTFKKVREKKE